jgi:small subunit ribosomal protein S3
MAIERKFVQENQRRVMLKEFLRRESERAGFGGLKIQRTPMGTLITMQIERPGLVIGKGGRRIKELTETIGERFAVENPQIEIEEVGGSIALNANVMAQKVASALERGWHFRRVGHSTVRRIMDAGARGCQVIIAGKLTGARHRLEKFTAGHVKYCGEVAKQVMDDGYAVAVLKQGIIGVKVRIMGPGVKLPDEVAVIEGQHEEVRREAAKAAKAAADDAVLETLEKIDVTEIPEVPANVLEALRKAGIRTAREVYEMDSTDLVEIKGIGLKRVEKLKEVLEEVLKQHEGEGDKSNE